MDYLKKFITINLYSIFGYYMLGYFIYLMHASRGYILAYVYGALYIMLKYAQILKYVLIIFTVELVIQYLIKFIFKRDIKINIQNKVYDFLVRLGILFSFVPLIAIGTMYSLIPLSPILDMTKDSNSDIILLLFYTVNTNFFIKAIFYKSKQ